MTRRQAIQVILSYLENKDDLDGNLREATVLLREFLTVLPIKIWDDQNIRQSVENFISVFHHSPSVKELDTTPSLPSHTIIKNYYKVTAGVYLSRYVFTTPGFCTNSSTSVLAVARHTILYIFSP